MEQSIADHDDHGSLIDLAHFPAHFSERVAAGTGVKTQSSAGGDAIEEFLLGKAGSRHEHWSLGRVAEQVGLASTPARAVRANTLHHQGMVFQEAKQAVAVDQMAQNKASVLRSGNGDHRQLTLLNQAMPRHVGCPVTEKVRKRQPPLSQRASLYRPAQLDFGLPTLGDLCEAGPDRYRRGYRHGQAR